MRAQCIPSPAEFVTILTRITSGDDVLGLAMLEKRSSELGLMVTIGASPDDTSLARFLHHLCLHLG